MDMDNDLETLVVPDSDVSGKEEDYTPICRTPSLKIKKQTNPNCGTPITKKKIKNTSSEVVEEENRTPIFKSLSPKIKKRINPDSGTVTKKKSKNTRSEVVEDINDVKNKEEEDRTPIFESPSPKMKKRINLDSGTVTKKKTKKSKKKKTGCETVNDINDVEKKENGCDNSQKNGENVKFESKFLYLNDVLEREDVKSTFMRMLTFFKEEELNEMERKHEQAAMMQIEAGRLGSELVVKIHNNFTKEN